MTQDQLILFKELIKEVVNTAVKAAVKEELETSFKKDLKEVKQLLAKSIKEAREANLQPRPQQSYQNPEDFKTKLREAVGSDFSRRPASPYTSQVQQPMMPQITQEAGMAMSVDGTLPNIDAPIPFINKGSMAWKEMKEKLG
jgi:glutamine synthetase adenylyltransferase